MHRQRVRASGTGLGGRPRRKPPVARAGGTVSLSGMARAVRSKPALLNNGRFLILPWAQVKGLASKILALSARRMPRDWEIRYGRCPLLLETLVDAKRFRGTCYRAANWIHVGQTTGRGRMDREHTAHGQAVKDIYVYPLAGDLAYSPPYFPLQRITFW